MKRNIFYLTIILGLAFQFACDDDEAEKITMWDSDPIQEYSIEAIYGGAIVAYDIPNDENLLYVMVEYERDGEIYTEKSSIYNNQVRIEGFNHQNEVTAQLYKVNKNGERSRPLEIKFTPLESVVKLTYQSLDLTFTFGGVIARSEEHTSELQSRE